MTLGSATDCADNTCLTSLYVTPGTLAVAGATTLNGGVTLATTTISKDATVSGGTLNVTTSNTATSTIIGGCFQFYATSTATALNFQASTTPGVMYSQYGSCPNL